MPLRLVFLLALSTCDSAGPEARAAGTYDAETYGVVEPEGTRDLVPALDGQGPGFSERMTGTYRVKGDAVVFASAFGLELLALD